MKSKLWWLIAAVAILGCMIYWYGTSRNSLQIDPHAAREIEKAKRR